MKLLTLLMLMLACTNSVIAADPARQKAADRPRRIIYNNDGGEPAVEMKQPTAQCFLDCRTTKLAGTHVDSIFYCTRTSGFGVFTHFTKIGQVFTCTEGRYAGNQMAALLAANIDPLKVQVEFGHKNNIEVFWSMRMNDTHDGSKTDYGPIMFRDNKLKSAHPEYLLGTIAKPLKHGAWSAVDYARPEVRDLAFRYIEEVCRNYDIDGVELDFFRHPVFFKSTSRGEPATAAERDAMTDLMRRIRTMADEVAKSRGRPILIAMKSPDSVEYCRTIGLDLESWMQQGLLDLFIPGGYFQLNEWRYSVALARKHGVKVYPSLDESRLKDATANAARVAATGYRGRAASVGRGGRRRLCLQLLRRIGGSPQGGGRPQDIGPIGPRLFRIAAWHQQCCGWQLPLRQVPGHRDAEPGESEEARTREAHPRHARRRRADGRPDAAHPATVRFQVKNAPGAKDLHAIWNGHPLALTGGDSGWFDGQVAPESVQTGINRVELILVGDVRGAVLWTDLVLRIRHQPELGNPPGQVR